MVQDALQQGEQTRHNGQDSRVDNTSTSSDDHDHPNNRVNDTLTSSFDHDDARSVTLVREHAFPSALSFEGEFSRCELSSSSFSQGTSDSVPPKVAPCFDMCDEGSGSSAAATFVRLSNSLSLDDYSFDASVDSSSDDGEVRSVANFAVLSQSRAKTFSTADDDRSKLDLATDFQDLSHSQRISSSSSLLSPAFIFVAFTSFTFFCKFTGASYDITFISNLDRW